MRIVKFQLDHTPDADVQILTTADLFKDRLSHRHIYLGEQIIRGIEDLEGVETCYHHRYAVFVHFGKLFDAGEVTKRIMDYLDSYVFKPLTAQAHPRSRGDHGVGPIVNASRIGPPPLARGPRRGG